MLVFGENSCFENGRLMFWGNIKNISKLSRRGFRVHNRDVGVSRLGNFIDVRSGAIESSPGAWGGHI